MRHLIELDTNSELVINPSIYSLAPFKVIWDRDKSKSKNKAHKDLAYIFWMSDFRSYVSDITDEVERSKEVISLITEDGNYVPDEIVKEAIVLYKKDVPLSLNFLQDIKVSINELRRYFRELDLAEIDDKGKLVHNANQVMNSIKGTGDLLETMEKLETKVKKDIDMMGSTRGAKTKSIYED